MLLCLRLREARARITAASSTGVVQSSTASPLLVACAAQSRRQLTLRALQSAEQPMAGGGALRRRRQPCVFQRAGAASWSCPRRQGGRKGPSGGRRNAPGSSPGSGRGQRRAAGLQSRWSTSVNGHWAADNVRSSGVEICRRPSQSNGAAWAVSACEQPTTREWSTRTSLA
jgi:hypothetical protein